MKLLALTIILSSCSTATVDKIVIRSPNWLPGVDIHLDIEEDVEKDLDRLTPSPNDRDD